MTTSPPAADGRFAVRRTAAPRSAAERARLLAAPRFGEVFTDHMARAVWTAEAGWGERRVEPYAPLSLDPATAVLHYGQEICEGLTAHRHADGSVWSFRPEANAARFAAAARRMALPELPVEDVLASIETLVRVDEAWVPDGPDASLYLRPVMFASEALLVVRGAHRAEYLVIASPVGADVAAGVRPVSIWVSQHLRRAGRGGTGAVTTMGNYAASLAAQVEAHAHGGEQVCFLDAATGRNLEQLCGMNLVLVRADGQVVTPELDGSILPGIIRDSVLTLLREAGHEVVEREVPLADVLEELKTGEVTEMFGTGTGAVVSPIGRILGHGFDRVVGEGGAGPVSRAVRERLTDIQFGRTADRHGWLRRLV